MSIDWSCLVLEWHAGPPPELLEGMVVKVGEKPYLVGAVNELGGVCDDCRDFRHDEITKWAWALPVKPHVLQVIRR
jgi:hypothetical protein